MLYTLTLLLILNLNDIKLTDQAIHSSFDNSGTFTCINNEIVINSSLSFQLQEEQLISGGTLILEIDFLIDSFPQTPSILLINQYNRSVISNHKMITFQNSSKKYLIIEFAEELPHERSISSTSNIYKLTLAFQYKGEHAPVALTIRFIDDLPTSDNHYKSTIHSINSSCKVTSSKYLYTKNNTYTIHNPNQTINLEKTFDLHKLIVPGFTSEDISILEDLGNSWFLVRKTNKIYTEIRMRKPENINSVQEKK